MIVAKLIRRAMAGALIASVVCLCVLAWSGDAMAVKAEKGPKLFGTLEFKGKLKKLPKWTSVLSKMVAWKGFFMDKSSSGLPAKSGWLKLKESAGSMSNLDKLKAVNKFFNQWPYRLDQANYGQSDYWASPPEFLQKSGDCEDYSIAKFYALQEVGFTTEQMRVVALKDRIRNIGHAVLAVYTDGEIYILDNQTMMVLPHTKYKHYIPQYSVNEKYRWMHIPPSKKSAFKKKK